MEHRESESSRDLLVRGIAAAKAKEFQEARFYLEWVLRITTHQQHQIDAWYWLSEISTDPAEKRSLLETILATEPTEARARRSLAVLDGKLIPSEIINPDHLGSLINEETDTQARRFTCPSCGGRMTFTPDGQSLTCEYCESRQRLNPASGRKITAPQQDFILALATAKGHLHPVAWKTFNCQGCGANFILPPQQITLTCPYCASAYVVEEQETRQFVRPGALVPFALSEYQAKISLKNWLGRYLQGKSIRVMPGVAIYLPVWSFNVIGQIPWRGMQHDGNQWLPVEGLKLVSRSNILVPATNKLAEACKTGLIDFSLDGLVNFDERYLADWPAETYQVSVSDASLDARHLVLELERQQVQASFIQQVRDLTLSSANILVESFQLILLPAWLTNYSCQDASFHVLINGQNGKVRGEIPGLSIKTWLQVVIADLVSSAK